MYLPPPRSILITGASSGLGEGLALCYAAQGVTLFLAGRDAQRLEQVAEACRQRGADVLPKVLDVTDAAATEAWVLKADSMAPLDLIIANAGISAGTASGSESTEQTRLVFATNIDGVVNTIMPVVPAMRARHRGQIAIVSSLASFVGLAGSPAYSASKACVRTWGEALRSWLAKDRVTVSVITPGFVTTRMTAGNHYRMPFLMDCNQAVKIIRRGLDRGQGRIAFPTLFYWFVLLITALPLWWREIIIGRLPRKA